MKSLDTWLRSEETGAPFQQCVECRLPLLEIDAPWLVNKDYFRGECLMEYAICQPCRDLVSARISARSKAAVRRFLENEIPWEERVAEFMQMPDPADRFAACVACQAPREESDGFAISALFDSGGHLTTGALPLLMCRACIGRMTADLSDESREVWKRFLASHFPGPPDGGGDGPLGEFGIF